MLSPCRELDSCLMDEVIAEGLLQRRFALLPPCPPRSVCGYVNNKLGLSDPSAGLVSAVYVSFCSCFCCLADSSIHPGRPGAWREVSFHFDHPRMRRHCPLWLHSFRQEWNFSLCLRFTYTRLQDKWGISQRYLLSMREQAEFVLSVCLSGFKAFSLISCQLCKLKLITPDKTASTLHSSHYQPQNHNKQLEEMGFIVGVCGG